MAKRSHVNHFCVESSTILLKPPVMVWWKLWGYKFTDHLCDMLRCDCDGLFVCRLKEVGSNDSSGPTSTSNGKWIIKGVVVMFVRIYSWPVLEVMLINCVVQIKMCLVTHQRVVWQFSVNIPWNWRQNCKRTSLSHSINACIVCNLYRRFWSLCRMHHTLLSDMPTAWVGIHADCLGLRPMDANTWAMFSGVRTEDGRPGGFYMQQTFFTPWPYLLTDCIWRWGFQKIQFTAKSALSLCNGPHPNKEFHSMHTFSNSPLLHVD